MSPNPVDEAKSFYDRLPVLIQHAILLAVAMVVLAGLKYETALHLPALVDFVLAPVLTLVGAWATAITKQYGVGKPKA